MWRFAVAEKESQMHVKNQVFIRFTPIEFDLAGTRFKRFRAKRVTVGGGGGGTTRPLSRGGGAEEFCGDPTVGPYPKVWAIDQE